MTTPNSIQPVAGAQVDGQRVWRVRILCAVIFTSIFILALVFTDAKFPPDKVSDQIAVSILSYSIYVAVLCGLGALMVELIHVAYAEGALGWRNPDAFAVYIVLTVLPAIYVTFYVSELAALLVCPEPAKSQEVLGNIALQLELLAPTVVLTYLIADSIGLKWGKKDGNYGWLVFVDSFVLFIHANAIALVVKPQWVPYFGKFPQRDREWFCAGAIVVTLILQNIAFGFISARGIPMKGASSMPGAGSQ